MKWLRYFDNEYWQMREALGYPIPSRIAKRWAFGDGSKNPFFCGFCENRRLNPELRGSSFHKG